MNKLAILLIGSALSAIIATSAFAADKGTSPAPFAPAKPAAAAPATGAAAASMAQAVKIGYIDMAKIAAESADGKAAAAALKAKSAKLRTRIEAKQKQLEKQKEAIEAKLEGMPANERAAKGKEFQKKMEEYQKLLRSSEEEMLKMQEKLTSDLYKVIKKAASTTAKSHGYLAVVEQKATLYLDDKIESKDLTEEISALLNVKPAK